MGTRAKTAPTASPPGSPAGTPAGSPTGTPTGTPSGASTGVSPKGSPGEHSEETAEVPVVVEEALLAELPVFETFFKTFGFKRVHGRVWGLLVLGSRPLSSKDIAAILGISQGATSTTVTELTEWGAVSSRFDSQRRCHLHEPVGNVLSIVATVFRRREQVAFQQFRQMTQRSLTFIRERHGEKDPRVVTLRSILTTCDIGEAVMQLVFSAVQNAMIDPESLLSRAVNAAFKVGVGLPARVLLGHPLGAPPTGEEVSYTTTETAQPAAQHSVEQESDSAAHDAHDEKGSADA